MENGELCLWKLVLGSIFHIRWLRKQRRNKFCQDINEWQIRVCRNVFEWIESKKTSKSFCPSSLKNFFLLPMCHLLQGKLWENFLWTMYAKIFIKKTFQSWIRPRQHLWWSFCRLVLWFTYTIHLLQQQKILQPATKLRHPRQSKNRQLQREFYIQYICFSSAVYSGVWVWAIMNIQSCFYLGFPFNFMIPVFCILSIPATIPYGA